MRISALLFAAVAFALVAADAPKEFQGTWVVTKMERGGKEEKDSAGDTFTVEGEKFKIWSKKENKEIMTGTIKIDTSKKPATCEMSIAGPDGKEVFSMPGLMKLDGDTLQCCFNSDPTSKDRPKEIAANEKTMLVTLKKEKK